MKAYGNSFSVIRNEYFYEIPFFQRRYVWDEENWSELLESLSNPDSCPFLGSIILKENKDSENGIFWTVIDGQQRLTTLSILMRACYDELEQIKNDPEYFPPNPVVNFWDKKVGTPFFEITHVMVNDCDLHTKIRHSHIDHVDFEMVMRGDFRDKYAEVDAKKAGKIVLCYAYFRKMLKEIGAQKTYKVIWNYLTKQIGDYEERGKYLVVIELGENENEQAIFDTINTSGVRLTCADTIKNNMFQRYIELLRKNDFSSKHAQKIATQYYKDKWESLFSSTQESVAYWSKFRQVGRLYRDNIEILLHCVAVIKGFYNPSEQKMSDLPQCYKAFVANLSKTEIEAFISEINDYAKLYQDSFEEFDSSTRYSFHSDLYVSRLMHIVDVLEISTFFPYILHLLYQRKYCERNDVKGEFLALERYLILHAICGESTKNYNKECLQLIRGESIDALLNGCEKINYESFEYGLRHIESNKLATLLLFWIELFVRRQTNADLKELPYIFTLEHIMPQKWKQYWSINVLPVYDESNEIVSDEEIAASIRTTAIYEIGNMTLLNSKLNTSLRNYEFKRKVNGEGRKRGMKDLADCMITKKLLDIEIWNEKIIRNRSSVFSEVIKQLWGLSFD